MLPVVVIRLTLFKRRLKNLSISADGGNFEFSSALRAESKSRLAVNDNVAGDFLEMDIAGDAFQLHIAHDLLDVDQAVWF